MVTRHPDDVAVDNDDEDADAQRASSAKTVRIAQDLPECLLLLLLLLQLRLRLELLLLSASLVATALHPSHRLPRTSTPRATHQRNPPQGRESAAA